MSETKRSPLESGQAAESIAIVGIGCRYADARGPEEFWEIVRSGRNTVRDAPQHRIELGYDIDHFYDPRPRIPGKISSKKGGFLEHPELFDPAPFGIAPRDALTMEPQQRLMVEVTWDALEDAGIVPAEIAGERVAVMLGYMAEDYSRERTGVLGEEAVFRGHDVFTVGGMSHAVLSGRIAFLLGVTGPSFTLDTACSSSLIATHLACQSLLRGESNLALAGGANLFLSPEGNIALSRSGMLSMSGACKAFDASADGFVRAEGAGVVVLKRLSDALRDHDPIYAVIRGSGISTDGRDGGHMMAPGRKGQAQAMRDAYAQAGVDPADVQYVETHGTGTTIGDPVEIGALADVMGPGRDPERPLLVASVKGNLGHTESASGVAGLIKACLAIRHRTLPAQLHFETPNPMIPWDEIPVRVQSETTPWPYEGQALVGVNSFGISGTNAHVVLEGPPERPARDDASVLSSTVEESPRPCLLTITAHDSNALHDMVEATRQRLERCDQEGLEDLAYTFARHRSQRAHRLSVSARSVEAMRGELDGYLAGEASAAIQTGIAASENAPKIVMVFPGQGSQWLGMGRDLLRTEIVFAESIDRIDAAYAPHVDWSLRSVLDGTEGIDWTERLAVLQPVLVAVEIALADLWASWGIHPTRVVGQSMGEIAAAHVAGALSLEDVGVLACHRGQIVSRATGEGAMAVVSLSREEVEQRLSVFSGGVELAGVNSPSTTIVSGDRAAVVEFVECLDTEGLFARLLEVDFASHCFHMDPLVDDFRKSIESIAPGPAERPFDSTVDGETKTGVDLGPDYWVRNLREPVAFDQGLRKAIEAGGEIFLEVSPHPTLPRAIEEIHQPLGRSSAYVSSLQRNENEQESLVRNLGALYARGAFIDPQAIWPVGRVVEAPLYAYQRQRYWFSERNRLDRFRPNHPLLGAVSESSIDPRFRSWDFVLDADSAGFVGDSRFAGESRLSSGLVLELAIAVAEATWPGSGHMIRDLEMHRPIALGVAGRRQVQVVLCVEGGTSNELRVSSRENAQEGWTLHAICHVESESGQASARKTDSLDRAENESLANEEYEAALTASGFQWSPRATTLRELEAEPGIDGAPSGIVGRMMLPRLVEAEWHAFHAHPALLEGSFQLASALSEERGLGAVSVESIGRFSLVGGLGSDCWCRVRPRSDSGSMLVDYEFFDREGQPIGLAEAVRLRRLPVTSDRVERAATQTHRVEWSARVADTIPPEREIERWILVSDDAAEAGLLATELQKLGAECRFCEKVEDLGPLTRSMQSADDRPWGFVLMAWGEASRTGSPEPEAHRAFRVASWAEAIRSHTVDARQVWIATRGLQAIAPWDGTAREIGGHVAREIETFTDCVEMHRCHLFDASVELLPGDRIRLASLMGVASEERQFVVRGEEIFVPRLVEAQPEASNPAGVSAGAGMVPVALRNYRAESRGERQSVGGLVLREVGEPELSASSVIVEVKSVALSQLDVLADLGLARNESNPLGRDFAGVVLEVGEAVEDLAVGDAVAGVHEGAFARRLAVERSFLVRKPSFFSFNEAASLPYAFLVARYSLEVVGRLRAGERLLVASSSGGIGRAMVSVARSIGAEVSTASSSASPVGNEEFDVIVGAESGAPMHALVSRLAPGGRYLDLCPRFDFERPEIGALRLGANRSLTAIDVRELMRSDPALVSALLEKTFEEAERGVSISMSTTVFPVRGAGRALRFMAQNRHRGRVCIDVSDPEALQIEPMAADIASGSLAGRGPFLVSGEGDSLRDGVVEWLHDRYADWVVVSSCANPLEDLAKRMDPSDRIGGWIHFAHETSGVRDRTRERLILADADVRILVSLRPPVVGEPARDRAWETRLWLDGLMTSSTPSSGTTLDLSVGEATTVDSVVEVLDRVMQGETLDSQIVLLDEAELEQRLTTASSPLLSGLEQDTGASGRGRITRAEFQSLSTPERRVEMQRFVLSELAQVLGLDDAQRDALDPASRLDSVGLDSLMSLELFMGMGRSLEIEISQDWFDSIPTIAEIGVTLADRYAAAIDRGSD